MPNLPFLANGLVWKKKFSPYGVCIGQGGLMDKGENTYLHTYKHAYIDTHTYICTYIHANMHCIHKKTCIHAYKYGCIHTYIHTYIHAYIHTYMHACIHTYLHTYMHACTHTYIHMQNPFCHGHPIMVDTPVNDTHLTPRPCPFSLLIIKTGPDRKGL